MPGTFAPPPPAGTHAAWSLKLTRNVVENGGWLITLDLAPGRASVTTSVIYGHSHRILTSDSGLMYTSGLCP